MRIISALMVFFALGLSAKAQSAGYGNHSKVMTDSLYSEILGDYRDYNIYLPKDYDHDVDKSYPVLYLLHGMNDNHLSWYHRGHIKDVMDQLVASGEACEMIIVTPNAGGNIFAGEWNGYFNMPGWSYEDFFYNEFLPYIESRYRVISDKQHRAVAGLSMGGGGATAYGQKHYDMFCAVYAMSALMNIPEIGAVPHENPQDKIAMLTESVIANSCVDHVADAEDDIKEQLRSVKWYVDCGDDDFLLDRNIEFVQAMRSAGIPCEFRVRDGGHTWEYWHSALYTCLPFVTRCFRLATQNEN